MLGGGKARIKIFLKNVVQKISNQLDPNDLLEVLTETLKGLSPEIIRGLLRALQNLERPLYVGAEVAIMGISREQREDAIYNLVFEKIKEIVSNTDPAESSPEKIADHPLLIDDKQRTLSNVIINDFDYPMLSNLIHRIQEDLNQKKCLDETPNPEALMAMEGLIYILMEKRKEQPTSNPDEELNLFITCCFNDEIKNMLPKQRYETVINNLGACPYRLGNAWDLST